MGEEAGFPDDKLVGIGESDLESLWVLCPCCEAYQLMGNGWGEIMRPLMYHF